MIFNKEKESRNNILYLDSFYLQGNYIISKLVREIFKQGRCLKLQGAHTVA